MLHLLAQITTEIISFSRADGCVSVCIYICIQMWICISESSLMCDRLSQRTQRKLAQIFVVSRFFTHTVQTDRNMMLIFFNSKCNVFLFDFCSNFSLGESTLVAESLQSWQISQKNRIVYDDHRLWFFNFRLLSMFEMSRHFLNAYCFYLSCI